MELSASNTAQRPVVRRRKFQAKPIAVAGQQSASSPLIAVSAPPQQPNPSSLQDMVDESLLSSPFSTTTMGGRGDLSSMMGSPRTPGSREGRRSRLVSSTESLAAMPKEKRENKVEKDGGKLDTEKHTLGDLVQWRPPGENTLQKKWAEKREQLLENISCQSSASVNSEGVGGSRGAVIGASAPRVVMNDDGEMVVLDEEPGAELEEIWETGDDGLMPKKLNSMSFRKNFKRSSNWISLETDLFYEVMAATGTDFALMHDYIPIRSRAELKKKFTKEQKDNLERVNEVLRNPCLLDESLQQRADRLLKKIEKEQGEKRGKRRRRTTTTTKKEGEEDAENRDDEDEGD